MAKYSIIPGPSKVTVKDSGLTRPRGVTDKLTADT